MALHCVGRARMFQSPIDVVIPRRQQTPAVGRPRARRAAARNGNSERAYRPDIRRNSSAAAGEGCHQPTVARIREGDALSLIRPRMSRARNRRHIAAAQLFAARPDPLSRGAKRRRLINAWRAHRASRRRRRRIIGDVNPKLPEIAASADAENRQCLTDKRIRAARRAEAVRGKEIRPPRVRETRRMPSRRLPVPYSRPEIS